MAGLGRQSEAQQVVLYNEADKRVILRDVDSLPGTVSATPVTKLLDFSAPLVCPHCQRPYNDREYVDQDYFRLLDVSTKRALPLPPELADLHNIPLSAFNQGYYARFFREASHLGHGARGSVYRVQHVLESEYLGEYAVKKVPVGDDPAWLTQMLNEVHVMEALRHPNIVGYKHAWLEVHQLGPFGPPVPCLFILMELANNGNLEGYVLDTGASSSQKDRVNERRKQARVAAQTPRLLSVDEITSLAMGVASGLAYLHRRNIIHRDLKPSNILLNSTTDSFIPSVLISDFGECNAGRVNSGDIKSRRGTTGTLEFCAPELLRINPSSGLYEAAQSVATDMWSFGMILYFLCYRGLLPYRDIDDVAGLRQDISNLSGIELPTSRKELPAALLRLVEDLLSIDPQARPTADQAYGILARIATGNLGGRDGNFGIRTRALGPANKNLGVVTRNIEPIPTLPPGVASVGRPECWWRSTAFWVAVTFATWLGCSYKCYPLSAKYWITGTAFAGIFIMMRMRQVPSYAIPILLALIVYLAVGGSICSQNVVAESLMI